MRYPPGFWREIRPLDIFGIPAPMFSLYLFWCRFPSMNTIYVCTGVLIVFRLISFFGWTPRLLYQRAVHLFRGTRIAGRPWWYRHFTE
ncbi:conjugal transfer protein [Citrobacter amalonaticus]|nr:hypothetical protein HMPREF9694_05481 [Klebsiella michiganensis]ELB4230277.1 conjugal transfer protein [Citrobacter amalonaticus]